MSLLKRCLELYKIRENIIPIFLLIGERERRVNRDIRMFMNLKTMNEIQLKYLESLTQTLAKITKKNIIKISELKDAHSFLGKNFIINGMV